MQELVLDDSQLSPYERLFVGYAEADTHIAQASGINRLRAVIEEKPSWAVARAMLAQGLANLGNDQRRKDLLEEAAKEFMIAEALLPKNPFVIAVGVQVLAAKIVHARENGQSTLELESAAEVYAAKLLNSHSTYLYGRITRARLFSALDQPNESVREWKGAMQYGGGSMVRSCIVCLLLRLGKLEEVKTDWSPYAGWAYILDDDTAGALRVTQIAPAEDSLLSRVWRNYIRKMAGEEVQAQQDWQDIHQNAGVIPRWLLNPLDLFTGNRSVSDLEYETAQTMSRFWEGHTHFCIGSYFLANSNRDAAILHFEKCIEANAWQTDFHHGAYLDSATSRHWRSVTRLTATPAQAAEKLHCYHNMMCKRCVLSYNMWYPIRLFQQPALGLRLNDGRKWRCPTMLSFTS